MGKNKNSDHSGYRRNAASDVNSTGNSNRGYHGEPPVQHISSRERNFDQIQMQRIGPRSHTAIHMQPNGRRNQTAIHMQPNGRWSQTDIQMQPMGPMSQTDKQMQHMGRRSQTDVQMQHTGPRSHTGMQMQHMGPRSQADIQMQPIGPKSHAGMQMQHMGPRRQTSTQMQPIEQQMSIPQANVHYVMQPLQNGHQSYVNAAYGHTTPGMYVNGPGNQYMVRDTMSPMPSDKENTGREYTPSIGSIIFKRIFSTLFILLDIFLNWIQYASWVDNFEGSDWLNFLETANSLKGKSKWRSQCSEGSSQLTESFTIIIIIGTVYGLLRIVNMVGETILEYKKQYPSDIGNGCKGFQILHGWVETLLGFLCDDLPQAILLVLFNLSCHLDYTSMGKLLAWTIIKVIKNSFRIATCKQIYKPLCHDCNVSCCDDCCKDCCRCCNEPCCDGCCKDICCDFSDCFCKRESGCFGEINKDPTWAFNAYENLQTLQTFLFVAMIVIPILKEKNIIGAYQDI